MWKERERLKDVADTPLMHRQVDALLRIEPHILPDADATNVGAHQSRDAIEQRGFAGAGRPKENADTGGDFERYIQNERRRERR